MYEQVLREGPEEDIRYHIEIDKLLDLWNDLVFPVAVRTVWTDWHSLHEISGFT